MLPGKSVVGECIQEWVADRLIKCSFLGYILSGYIVAMLEIKLF